jgi:hypothetical protein
MSDSRRPSEHPRPQQLPRASFGSAPPPRSRGFFDDFLHGRVVWTPLLVIQLVLKAWPLWFLLACLGAPYILERIQRSNAAGGGTCTGAPPAAPPNGMSGKEKCNAPTVNCVCLANSNCAWEWQCGVDAPPEQ